MKNKLIELLNDSFAKQDEKRGLLTAHHTAEDLIANGVTIQRWIPVEEGLPERKRIYLVHCKHSYSDVDGYWAMGTTFFDGIQFNVGYAYKVTHWMPLPEPPKEEER